MDFSYQSYFFRFVLIVLIEKKSWYYLENMLVCRIDHRKMAVVLDESKRVNGMQNQLKKNDTIGEYDRNKFFSNVQKITSAENMRLRAFDDLVIELNINCNRKIAEVVF